MPDLRTYEGVVGASGTGERAWNLDDAVPTRDRSRRATRSETYDWSRKLPPLAERRRKAPPCSPPRRRGAIERLFLRNWSSGGREGANSPSWRRSLRRSPPQQSPPTISGRIHINCSIDIYVPCCSPSLPRPSCHAGRPTRRIPSGIVGRSVPRSGPRGLVRSLWFICSFTPTAGRAWILSGWRRRSEVHQSRLLLLLLLLLPPPILPSSLSSIIHHPSSIAHHRSSMQFGNAAGTCPCRCRRRRVLRRPQRLFP